mmetsp:Transcript_3585/g.8108  ORF Transcript_3585/g.8108 Transcript_3585/m.8108 type:complete len:273 (-) Transcript_3585:24-842(-)
MCTHFLLPYRCYTLFLPTSDCGSCVWRRQLSQHMPARMEDTSRLPSIPVEDASQCRTARRGVTPHTVLPICIMRPLAHMTPTVQPMSMPPMNDRQSKGSPIIEVAHFEESPPEESVSLCLENSSAMPIRSLTMRTPLRAAMFAALADGPARDISLFPSVPDADAACAIETSFTRSAFTDAAARGSGSVLKCEGGSRISCSWYESIITAELISTRSFGTACGPSLLVATSSIFRSTPSPRVKRPKTVYLLSREGASPSTIEKEAVGCASVRQS